jgi:tyrosine-protein kinase Etk/Wzc
VQSPIDTPSALSAPNQDDEISLAEIVQALRRRWRLISGGALGVGLVALGLSFLIPNTYIGRVLILPPQQQGGGGAALAQLGALAGAAASVAGIKNPVDQYVGILKSKTVADRLVQRFDLREVYHVTMGQDARDRLSGRTQFQAGKDGLIRIDVTDESPQRAADLANAYVEELDRLLESLALGEARQRRVFFERQLKETHEHLIQAQAALQSVGVSANTLKLNPQSAVESVARLNAQVMANEVRIAAMRGYLSEQSFEVRQAQRELAALRAQLKQMESSGPSVASGEDRAYLSRYRDFKYQETLFEVFSRQFELAKADEAREGVLLQVVDRATPADRKSAPRRSVIAVVATVVAGFLLSLMVLIRERVFSAS